MIHYRTAAVGDHQIFYREAGDPSQTSLLLLHGFPSSSHMFRNLIPLLSDRFHIVAPDLLGSAFRNRRRDLSSNIPLTILRRSSKPLPRRFVCRVTRFMSSITAHL